MKLHQDTLTVETRHQGFTNVTERVAKVVAQSGVHTGLCTVFIAHTSASLLIQENADESVLSDLVHWMDRLAPESSEWDHDAEGMDDMPSHLRSSVTRTSETIPVRGGLLALGTWQAIYIWEHRRKKHTRTLVVTVLGDGSGIRE